MIWYSSDNPGSFAEIRWKRYSIDEPCVTIMAFGMGGDSLGHWHLERDGRPEFVRRRMHPNKPPYHPPPPTATIMQTPHNGLTHVSTFSGTGGTCLGFRLAGFRTLYANDIDAHARKCYRLNFPSPIDGRDIRFVTGEDLLDRLQLASGALDVFEGSPPCTAFSTAGKREKGWGQTKEHAGRRQTNVEDLFYEWLRVLGGLRPRAFVAENVAGMTRGVAKGYYLDVLRRMIALGYQADARILDAQYLGVPQQRTRVIFIGIRNDLGIAPRFPVPLPWTYSVREALPWLDGATHDPQGWHAPQDFIDAPCPTLTVGGIHDSSTSAGHYQVRDVRVQEGAAPAKYRSGAQPSPPIMAGRVTNLEVQDGANQREWHPITRPSPVILSGPGHVQLLRDGPHRRKFTMLEVKRLCSFPDDFQLIGSYAHQWARCGNSVPPLMAAAIGAAVRDVLLEVDGRAVAPARKKGRR